MQMNPTIAGGAIFRATLARARVATEYDAAGQIIHHAATPREPAPATPAIEGSNPRDKPVVEGATPAPVPRPPTSADLRLMADRLDVCAPPIGPACPDFGGAGERTVRCEGCGCAGLSLRSGACKRGAWPMPA